MNSNLIKRIRIVVISVFAFALVIAIKLFSVQVINGDEYAIKADRQYVKETNIALLDRGSIFFSSKDNIKIAAATIKDGYNLSINPKILKNPEQVYEALSQYLEIDRNKFLEKAAQASSSYREIQRRLDIETGESIRQLRIPGVVVSKESWRIYPGDSLASNTIGLIGLDKKNNLEGRYGLESYYEDILSRKSMSTNTYFFAEIFSDIKKVALNEKVKEGDIVTSIEPTVQSYLETTLSDTLEKWDSDSIGGIIMDPKTGRIYAMGNLPNFNPNDLSNIDSAKVLSNPLIENVYEMGSIMKPLTMAAGIDSGAIKANSTYDDTGFLQLSGKKISNFDGKARGVVPMQEVLSQSLNVGVAYISLKMGLESFSKYFLSFGLGQKTGVDQPNEQKGIIKNLTTGRDVEVATISYGQGVALTPVQMVRALAVLANDGKLVTPHVIKSIEYIDGSTVEPVYPEPVQVLKKESTDDVTNMLIKVVDTSLKKGQVKMEHYSIAAKTGTAQIADPVNGGYHKDRYLHSFFGYFPAYSPKFIVFLYHVHPKGAQFASETLTDPFIGLTKLLINYYEIPPDR